MPKFRKLSKTNNKDGERQGLIFKKQYGQHILKNPLILQAMVDKAGIRSTDIVLEVGPGTGNLTAKLLQKAGKVHAFEVDPRMIAELHKRFQGTPFKHHLDITMGDVVRSELPKFSICVANLPYQISSKFIFKVLKHAQEHKPAFRCAILMVQKEFALRLCARPGDKLYSRLSVNAQFLCKVDMLMQIGRNNFRPVPNVDSTVVRLEPRLLDDRLLGSVQEFDALTQILFTQRKRTLAAIFKNKKLLRMLEQNYKKLCLEMEEMAPVDLNMLEKVTTLLENNNLNSKRAFSMDQDDLLSVLLVFNSAGIHFL